MCEKPVVTAVCKDTGHSVHVKLMRETKPVETETAVVEAAVAAELEVLEVDEKAAAERAAFALSLA